MNKKVLTTLLIGESLLCIILALCLPSESGANGYLIIAQFPFALIGQGLRSLSLSGAIGNVFAFILYAALCLVPVVFAAVALKKKRFKAEDTLLLVLSGFAFYMMYMMVNPALIGGPIHFDTEGFGKAVLGGVFYSILLGYLVLRLLRKTDSAPTDKLLKMLRLLLGIMAAVLILSIFYVGIISLKAQLAAIQSSNTDPSVSLGMTNFFLLLRFALTNLPNALEIVLFLIAMRLCGALMIDRYSEDVITTAAKLAAFSKKMVVTVLLSCITLNLLQVIFADALVSADFLTTLPLDAIILAFVMLLLSRFFTASRELAQDNQMFI